MAGKPLMLWFRRDRELCVVLSLMVPSARGRSIDYRFIPSFLNSGAYGGPIPCWFHFRYTTGDRNRSLFPLFHSGERKASDELYVVGIDRHVVVHNHNTYNSEIEFCGEGS